MNLYPVLEELIGLLERHGVKVRQEPIEESRGGLCRLRGRQVLFIDANADLLQSVTLCAKTLNKVTNLHLTYLRPNTREFIEAALLGDEEITYH
jgi:hypothetical protein